MFLFVGFVLYGEKEGAVCVVLELCVSFTPQLG